MSEVMTTMPPADKPKPQGKILDDGRPDWLNLTREEWRDLSATTRIQLHAKFMRELNAPPPPPPAPRKLKTQLAKEKAAEEFEQIQKILLTKQLPPDVKLGMLNRLQAKAKTAGIV